MRTFYQSMQTICFRDYYAMYAKHSILFEKKITRNKSTQHTQVYC